MTSLLTKMRQNGLRVKQELHIKDIENEIMENMQNVSLKGTDDRKLDNLKTTYKKTKENLIISREQKIRKIYFSQDSNIPLHRPRMPVFDTDDDY